MWSWRGRSHSQPTGPRPPPETIPAAPEPLRVDDPAHLFDVRARRLRALAAGHPSREWLLLLARISDGQREAVTTIRVQPVRSSSEGPPVAWDRVDRPGAWRRMLAIVLSAARGPGLPVETLDAMRRLGDAGVTHLEQIADGVLAGDVRADRVECAPFVGAALQAWFAALAAGVDPARTPRDPRGCPICGSRPVAAVVRAVDRARWLSCALCGSEWQPSRAGCDRCAGGDVGHFHAEDPGAHAEACGGCRAYLKLFYEEDRPGAIAAADDAATLDLDARMAAQGYRRAGANLYVAPVTRGTGPA